MTEPDETEEGCRTATEAATNEAEEGEMEASVQQKQQQQHHDDDDPTVSLSQHLHSELAKLTYDPSFPVMLAPFLQEVDAYISLSGESQAQLPPLDWNRVFRKAYTIALWIKVSLDLDQVITERPPLTGRKLLYRLSTNPEDSSGVGICATIGDWVLQPDNTTVSTTLTAFALPPKQSLAQVPLHLKINTWQLLAISHLFPYLKRPQWTVSVDGNAMGVGDVAYPVLDSNVSMGYCTVLSNVTEGAVACLSAVDDSTKTASELNAPPNKFHPMASLDVASIAIYPDAIPTPMFALLSSAGPQLSLQSHGKIVTLLPPVDNWTKGSSLRGVNVGIPLGVSGGALELQRLSSKSVYFFSAANSKAYRSRVVVPMQYLPGETESTPKVGLIQPGVEHREEETPPSLYVFGTGVVLHHLLSNYLLQCQGALDTHLFDVTKLSSISILEQGLLPNMVMPFFLANLPPSFGLDLQQPLYHRSLTTLYKLFSKNGEWAANLISLLSTTILHGGGRVHEMVLQSGLLHVLGTTLRRSLLRAQLLDVYAYATMDDFVANVVVDVPYWRPNHSQSCPKVIPSAIIHAMAGLIKVCCGVRSDQSSRWTSLTYIERSSDLAMTAVFGLALNLDIWGNQCGVLLGVVCDAYANVQGGHLLRHEIPIQTLMDLLRTRLTTEREDVSTHLANLVQHMLLSSLSNKNNIGQSERDIACCMGVLSDSPLGSLGGHVILCSLFNIMDWCNGGKDDDDKLNIATKLARNLLVSQYHDVIAPMLLSRSFFTSSLCAAATTAGSWEAHWRMTLTLFAWVTSIAGQEGVVSAQSTGALLLASGAAGSLSDCVAEGVGDLFLPAPTMTLMVGKQDSWSYTDLLTDRLAVMMPLLPGFVVSLLTSELTAKTSAILKELVSSSCGAVSRVVDKAVQPVAARRGRKSVPSVASNLAMQHVPYLLISVVLLEHHIRPRDVPGNTVMVLRTDSVDNIIAAGESLLDQLKACQNELTTTLTDMVNSVMSVSSPDLWNSILATLKDSVKYGASAPKGKQKADDFGRMVAHDILCRVVAIILTKVQKREYEWELWRVDMCSSIARLIDLVEEKDLLLIPMGEANEDGNKAFSRDQILLLCAIVDIMSYGRSMTGWCQLLLPAPPEPVEPKSDSKLSMNHPEYLDFGPPDETYDASRGDEGFYMESLDGRHHFVPSETPGTSSKLLLPILQPCLRIMLASIGNIRSGFNICIPDKVPLEKPFLSHITAELKETTTAAIVGLLFPNARDVSLTSLAFLRRANAYYKNANDLEACSACSTLFVSVVEEIRVRYEGERRKRSALFDASDDESGLAVASQEVEHMLLGDLIPGMYPAPSAVLTKKETEEIDFSTSEYENAVDAQSTPVPGAEDFVMFHEAYADGTSKGLDNLLRDSGGQTKMGWDQYKGLGSALEDCSFLVTSSTTDGANIGSEGKADMLASLLAPYLDTWDENAAKETSETELVKLFDDAHVSDKTETPSRKISNHQDDTAAEAMSTYIEMASSEKARLSEVMNVFLPSHRYSCQAYASRYCWTKYFDLVEHDDDCSMDSLWERGISDGNRDIRSRLITMPCNPQFKRFIPKHLDHGQGRNEPVTGPLPGDEVESLIVEPNVIEEIESKAIGPPTVEEVHHALMGAGNLAIVDITKKEIVDDELPDLLLGPESLAQHDEDEEFGDGSLGFPSRGEESDESSGKPEEGDTESTDSMTIDGNDDPYGMTPSKGGGRSHGGAHHIIASSLYAHPPDNSSSILSLMHSSASNTIEKSFEMSLHVKAEGSRKCTLLLTATHLILEYDGDAEGLYEGEMTAVREEAERQRLIQDPGSSSGNLGGAEKEGIEDQLERRQKEMAAIRPKSIRWNLSELSHVYLRRYRLRDSAIEMFFIPSGGSSYGGFGLYSPATSLFLDFGSGKDGNRRRDDAAHAIMRRSPPQTIKQWPDKSGQFLHEQLSRLTMGWVEGRITNFDYLLHLNMLAGRSYNDLCQYPVMPWVLSNYTSEKIPDLSDPSNFRDLTKPMGALNPRRLEDFMDRFETFADPTIPPFMYGSHYSTSAGVVLHFLVRMHPFAGLHRQLQGGNFDVADRLFSSIPRTWDMCTGFSAAEVKELTPEWYCNPAFLKNSNKFMFGTSQDKEVIDDVVLPPWAGGSPERFIEIMRNALESDICTAMLPDWIDLIFGRKQQGPEAIKAHNVFFYLTYYGSVDVASIEDEGLRHATELQIAHFGQCPMQLFVRPHVRRTFQMRHFNQVTFYQMLSAYSQGLRADDKSASARNFGDPLFLPFYSSPSSHTVHLDAPPPGPHVNLIGVRLAGIDRCLAVDSNGIFHSFRWAWKSDVPESVDGEFEVDESQKHIDKGFFIAQRELPRFRTVPRLIHAKHSNDLIPAVGISKTLFASRSVLLVLSDADGRGGLAMQLVDPAKASIKGEAIVPTVHAAKISCIAMDPIGTAAGHGGVGGELAMIGSVDGNSSLWRFMSSHYLPLRPRIRMRGHGGARIQAVAISSAIHICASVSANRICIFSVGNGALIRTWAPPADSLEAFKDSDTVTVFADTPALCLSVQGFVCAVCKTTVFGTNKQIVREVVSLHLFSLEGVSIGSKAIESWRGTPSKITCTPDGTAICVCGGRGVTIHRVSTITPLEFIDEWHITETEELDGHLPQAFDVDFGPSLMRPVVGAVALSGGALRLHALPGISAWSERHKARTGLGFGQALSKPAGRIRNALGRGFAVGKSALGLGKEVAKEVSTDVKERGVTGFLSGTLFNKTKK